MTGHSEADRGRKKTSGGWLDRFQDDGFAVAGICVFLAVIVWLAFSQTLRHAFINYDDDMYVYQNLAVTAGLTRQRNSLGIHLCRDRPLASGDVVLTHAGLPDLGPPVWRTSSDQRAPSCGGRDPSLSGLEANDRRALAERLRGGALCDPPAAGGIGGLDRGAEGCPERSFLHGDDSRLSALRG